jgi:hypothetical protein
VQLRFQIGPNGGGNLGLAVRVTAETHQANTDGWHNRSDKSGDRCKWEAVVAKEPNR